MMEERNSGDKKIHPPEKDPEKHPFFIDNLLQVCNPMKSLEIFSSKDQHNQTDTLINCKESPTGGDKRKRHRSTFTTTQIRVLEYEFMNSRYISTEHRSRLANFLGISEQQIKIWFQNRRYKTRLMFLDKNDPSKHIPNSGVGNQQHFTVNKMMITNNLLFTRQKNLNNIQSLFRYNTCTNFKNTVSQRPEI
uniref:Homeobox protein Nkx-3.1 (inferred by orthology to a human protein) n=1 Tax=Strongyloides venezuelensis TaxID=75913 RepID=A0A0K0FDT9_STRVS